MTKCILNIFLVLSFYFSHSQIVFNGSSTSGASGVGSLTFSKTVSAGNNSLLYVGITAQDKNISSVKWGTLTLTQFTIGTRNSMRVAMYYIALGDIASPTTSNVVVTLAGGTDVFAGAADYSGVWQAAPFVNPTITQAKNTNPSVTFASSVGNKAISLLGVIAAAPSANGPGQTQYWSLSGTHSNRSTEKAGASSVTMSHTIGASEDWVMIGGTMQDHAVLLPVELTAFNATCHANTHSVFWKTATEKNADYFLLERSVDGTVWSYVAKFKAKGTSYTETNYSYEDYFESNMELYYKLKQVDFDGTSTSHKIIHSKCETSDCEIYYLYPIPAHNQLHFNFELTSFHEKCQAQLINTEGKICWQKEVVMNQLKISNCFDITVPSGLYQLRLFDSFDKLLVQKQVLIERQD